MCVFVFAYVCVCVCVEVLPLLITVCFDLNQLSDSGIYTCVATSSSGETSWSAFLEVKGTMCWTEGLYLCSKQRAFFLI